MRKITYKLVGLYALIGFLCAACHPDDSIAGFSPDEHIPENYVKMTFTVKDASNPQTYETNGAFSDQAINDKDLMMLIFKNQTIKETGETALRYNRSRKMTPVADKPGIYSVLLPADMGVEAFDMVVCANASKIIGANPDEKLMYKEAGLAYEIGHTYEEVIGMLHFDVPATGWNTGTDFALLPMWGRKTNVTFAIDKAGQELNLGPIKLLRAVSRIDIGLNFVDGGTLADAPQGLGDVFKIVNVHVANTLNKGQFIPSLANYKVDETQMGTLPNPYTVTSPSVVADAGTTAWYEVAASSADGFGVIQKIFVPEQINTANLALDKRPCVIIEGDYKPQGAAKAIRYFYKLDLKRKENNVDTYLDILRGNLIRLNITAVNGPGLKTKEEALNSRPINVDVSIASYNLLQDNTVIDGQYYFSVAKKEVVMPRDANIKYALKVSTDIPVADWTLDWQYKDQFEITKFQDSLLIVNKKAWTANVDAQFDTLKITAKRLKMAIPIRQINMSASDWLMGSDEDTDITGGSISTTSLSLIGAATTSRVIIFSAYQEFEITNNALDWLTVRQAKTENTFTFETQINSTPVSRETEVTLSTPNGGTVYTVKVTQLGLPINDLLHKAEAIRWRSRNAGSSSNADIDREFKIYPRTDLVRAGNNICPTGWILPSIEDYKNLFKRYENFGYLTQSEESAPENKYLTVYNDVEKIYFMPHEKHLNGDNMVFWTSDAGFIQFGRTISSDYNGDVTESNLAEGYVRCVRKLKLEKEEVTLNMAGDEEYVNFVTLNNAEKLTITASDKNILVKVEGNRLAISRTRANMTNEVIKETVTVKASSGKPQTINVIQQAAVPLATDGNFVRVDNVYWYHKNTGASDLIPGSNGVSYAYYQDAFGSGGDTAGSSVPPTNTIAPTYFGNMLTFEEATNGCPSGWRLPTIREWETLISRTKIVESTHSFGNVPGNGQTFPIYLVTDGVRMMLFPIGASGVGKKQPNRITPYWSSSYSASTLRYFVRFSRLLNQQNGGAYILPGVLPLLSSKGNELVQYNQDTSAYKFYSRCVKSVK